MPKALTQILDDTLIERAESEMTSGDDYVRPDSLAWAAIGLHASGGADDLRDGLRRALVERQQPDGSIPLFSSTPNAWWPTSLALLAWGNDPAFATQRKLAVDFLLEHRGALIPEQPWMVGHDTTIHGWPWIGDTHSWVEPTSLVLMALFSEGLREHPVVREGVAMMKNRMLPDGGWNYGNTEVYGAQLLPMPECTGIALCAMRHELAEPDVQTSLTYLEKEYVHLRTPLSLGWAIMGLSVWGRRPDDVEDKVAESLSLQERYGPYETALIGLLAASLGDFPFDGNGGAR